MNLPHKMIAAILGLLTTLTLSASLAMAKTGAGNEGGGGGHTSPAEFLQIARAISSTFLHEPLSPFGVSGKDLISLVNRTTVIPDGGPLLLDGLPVEAINFPDKILVKLDVNLWPGLSTQKKVLLVVHELLGLLKQPDPGYVKSSEILNLIIKADTGDWTDSYQKLLTMSQPEMLSKVSCKIYKDHQHVPDRIVDLEPIAGGLGRTLLLSRDIKIEISVMYGPLRQIAVDVYPPCSKRVKCEGDAIGGKRIVSFTTNYIGEFKDFDMQLPKFQLRCEAK